MKVACLSPSELFDYCQVVSRISRELVGIDLSFRNYSPHEADLPKGGDFGAVLVMGSKNHVYSREPWMEETLDFLRGALYSDIPVMGVCFGHQLVGEGLGGRVVKMEEREFGFREIELTEEGLGSELFRGFPETFVSFTTHEDTVKRLPGARVLARNDFGLQSFESRDLPAFGIQFHPEYDLTMARKLLVDKGLDGNEGPRSTLTEERFEGSLESRRVFKNFFERVC